MRQYGTSVAVAFSLVIYNIPREGHRPATPLGKNGARVNKTTGQQDNRSGHEPWWHEKGFVAPQPYSILLTAKPTIERGKTRFTKKQNKNKKKQEIIIVTKQKKCGRVEPTDIVSCCHTLIPVGVVYTAVWCCSMLYYAGTRFAQRYGSQCMSSMRCRNAATTSGKIT